MATKRWYWPVVGLLILLQVMLALAIVHRESLTFDEGDHLYAGYMMWKAGDYGLNPEHPPLVKLLATLPALRRPMWLPPPRTGSFFKDEAYLNGRDWLARNDGAGQHLVFRMRAMAGLLALGFSLVVFAAARAWFGDFAGLVALLLVVFDPNVLANSALVTTDVGVSCFFVLSVLAFSRYAARPSWLRLCFCGLAVGLLLATKHSGILVGPILLLLIVWEVLAAETTGRKAVALRLCGALVAISAVAIAVLWAFYGFRYSARPRGLARSVSLAAYAQPLSRWQTEVVLAVARWHLLPESYLIGLVDVQRMAQAYPTFLLGTVYPHGVWQYFPLVLLIKTTLGLLALLLLALVAMVTRRLAWGRALVYTLVPPVVYFAIAVAASMDIGSRHLLPVYAFLFVLAAAGVAAMALGGRVPAALCAVLLVSHVISSLHAFPNEMAYANEAWGGPDHLHTLLSDANVDWAQQLYQVKAWQDRHPAEPCWFAYFARPEVDPATYGIRCHALPTLDTQWQGGEEPVPAVLRGAVLISAGDLSGCEWPSGKVNPYRPFQALQPAETLDHAVFVYQGVFSGEELSAVAGAQQSWALLRQHQPVAALQLAEQAVAAQPGNLFAETALGDAAAAVGNRVQAVRAWRAAVGSAQQLEPEAQPSYLPALQRKLSKLPAD